MTDIISNEIKVLTKVFQTPDGKMHPTQEAAEMHVMAEKMMRAIKQAAINARYDEFGATREDRFARRLAEELVRAGFYYNHRISYGS